MFQSYCAAFMPIRPPYIPYQPDYAICVTSTNISSASICRGDDGGPLVDKINNLTTVIGVGSFNRGFTIGCGSTPSYFAKVATAVEWIKSVVEA